MTDQSVSSCSSNPSTPLSSPPPLPGSGNGTSCRWPNNGPHYSFLPNFPPDRTPNTGVCILHWYCKFSSTLSWRNPIIVEYHFQGTRIVEERLDDAINVLRNHAECQSAAPQFSGGVPVGPQFHQYHVVRVVLFLQ